MVSLAERRKAAQWLEQEYCVSERRSCHVLSIVRSSKRRQSGNRDTELTMEIHRLSERYPRFGYRKIHTKLKESGWYVNRERVRLIRKCEGLQVIRKSKKKRFLGKSTTELSNAMEERVNALLGGKGQEERVNALLYKRKGSTLYFIDSQHIG